MSQSWIAEYLLLTLRIDKATRDFDTTPFIDCFYGPPGLKAVVEQEPKLPIDRLATAAAALRDSLPTQDFDHQRATYLEKQVRAMEAVCHKLRGQSLTLQDELQQCLDIQPSWKPEAEFEQALTLLDAALPGAGDLRARYRAWQARVTLPPATAPVVLPLMQRMLAEARRRTQHFVTLPPEEELEVYTVHGRSYGAANWYLGGLRSRFELNLDRPVNLFGLLYQICHEGYPGHHTEFLLKERHLYQERGYTEQSVFIIGPQLVIAEGIASLAHDMIFTSDEVAAWIQTEVLEEAGIPVDDVDLPKLLRATSAISLDDLSGNLVMMLRDGHSEEAVVDYALAYTPFTEEQVRQSLQSLKSPLMQLYACTYFHGKQLMQPLLQGSDRMKVFRRLLTEQVYPSLLLEWAAAQGIE